MIHEYLWLGRKYTTDREYSFCLRSVSLNYSSVWELLMPPMLRMNGGGIEPDKRGPANVRAYGCEKERSVHAHLGKRGWLSRAKSELSRVIPKGWKRRGETRSRRSREKEPESGEDRHNGARVRRRHSLPGSLSSHSRLFRSGATRGDATRRDAADPLLLARRTSVRRESAPKPLVDLTPSVGASKAASPIVAIIVKSFREKCERTKSLRTNVME